MSETEGSGPVSASMMLEAISQRQEEVVRLQAVQDQMVPDMEKAMNLIREYQRCLYVLNSPDPNFVEARQLLTKYGMSAYQPRENFKVFCDGKDITLHPDSVEGFVVEEELEVGIETAELVQDNETGAFRLVPKGEIEAPKVDTFAEIEEPSEPVDESSRDWLTEPNEELSCPSLECKLYGIAVWGAENDGECVECGTPLE